MRQIQFSAALLLMTAQFPAHADNGGALENCKTPEKVTRTIMTMRQDGVPASETMELVNQHFSDMPTLLRLNQDLVMKAYKAPLLDSPAAKQRVIDDWANAAFLGCMKASIK